MLDRIVDEVDKIREKSPLNTGCRGEVRCSRLCGAAGWHTQRSRYSLMVNQRTVRSARQNEMDISVVIPVYNEAEALPELYRALAEALNRLPQSAEIPLPMTGRPTARPNGSTQLPRPTRGFECSICRAITARPRR